MKIIDDDGRKVADVSKRTVDMLLWFRTHLPDSDIELEASVIEGLFGWVSIITNHITGADKIEVTIDDKFFDQIPKATILGLKVIGAYSETFPTEEVVDDVEK